MAMMNPLQQRLMLERMRRDPRMAALMAARQGGEGGLAELAGLPQGADNLAQLAGMEPPARVVTPGRPAPVEPGTEIRAPEVVAGQEVPPIPQVGMRPSAPEGVPQPQQGMTPLQAAMASAAAMEQSAMSQRRISPEVEAIYGRRTERYDDEIADLDQDRKRAGWEALATAGFRMAQSQSPYFMSALASGMEAGLTGFNAAKMARAERNARVQAAKEQIVLDRETRLDTAEDRERGRQRGMMDNTRGALAIGDAGLNSLLAKETYPFAVEEARLKPRLMEAQFTDRMASAAQAAASAGYYDRSPGAGIRTGGGGGGGGSTRGRAVSANRQSELRENFNRASVKANEATRVWKEAKSPRTGPEAELYRDRNLELREAGRAWNDARPGGRERFAAAKAAQGAASAPKRNNGVLPRMKTDAEANAFVNNPANKGKSFTGPDGQRYRVP
jgi:hypothetical protein